MLIRDWMAKDVLTVDQNTSLLQATQIMKENKVRKLPVVSHGKLLGIITDRDVHELYYLLSEMKVNEVMTKNPITIKMSDSLEKAAMIMLENKISGIPVLNDSGHLSGILSETDVLLGFIHATGIKAGATQYVFNLPDVPGAVTEVVKVLREHDARIISILTSYEDAGGDGMKQVAIRVTLPSKRASEQLAEVLAKQFVLVFHAKDELDDLPTKRGMEK